jgi:hypothetical protein
MPVEAMVLPDGNYYLPRSDEVIPADMATPSPDDRFHRCTYPLLAPMGTALATVLLKLNPNVAAEDLSVHRAETKQRLAAYEDMVERVLHPD